MIFPKEEWYAKHNRIARAVYDRPRSVFHAEFVRKIVRGHRLRLQLEPESTIMTAWRPLS
jgi:hypothetical protein